MKKDSKLIGGISFSTDAEGNPQTTTFSGDIKNVQNIQGSQTLGRGSVNHVGDLKKKNRPNCFSRLLNALTLLFKG